MILFDHIELSEGLPRAQETKFAYLNRSARPEAANVRAFITDCLARYPADKRNGLISRLRGDDEGHESALFELFIYEILVRSGFRIVAIEPTLPTGKTPDFLVETPEGAPFYLECVVSSGHSDKDNAAHKRVRDALDAIETVKSPGHFLSVKIAGRPSSPVKLSQLKNGLAAWIAALPAGQAARRAPPHTFSQNGLALEFRSMLERRGTHPDGGRTLGAIDYGIGMRRPGTDLRSSLVKKAGKYGDLGIPFVVAINNTDTGGNERDVLDALLGTPIAVFDSEGELEPRSGRATDGVWTGGNRPRKRGLSAVWSFDGVGSWRPAGRRTRLIRNPWASHPLPPVPLPGDQLNPVDGEFIRETGVSIQRLLGLEDDWP